MLYLFGSIFGPIFCMSYSVFSPKMVFETAVYATQSASLHDLRQLNIKYRLTNLYDSM